MDRRKLLLAVSSAGTVATAGCLTDLFESSPEGVTLPEPDDQLADSEDLAYPAYGEEFPGFSLPAATSDRTIDTSELSRVAVVSPFFASCPAECGILLNQIAGVQGMTIDRGITDEVYFLPITFDPARDDAERLRRHAETFGVDLSVGNWHYLRPATPKEAENIVSGELGYQFERTDDGRLEEGYDFTHPVLTWLVNPGGIVERVYRGERVDPQRLIDDIETVATEYDSSSQ